MFDIDILFEVFMISIRLLLCDIRFRTNNSAQRKPKCGIKTTSGYISDKKCVGFAELISTSKAVTFLFWHRYDVENCKKHKKEYEIHTMLLSPSLNFL